MRFAGDNIQGLQEDRPVVPGFNPDDLEYTPELPRPTPEQQYQRDNYILRPGSGVARQSGRAQEVALAPAVVGGINALTTGIKAYGAYRTGKAIGDGIRDPQTARDRGGVGMGRITGDLMDSRKERMDGPTLRSPYHQQ